MADQKISAMPSAATLTGAELIPLVQSGANVQATVADLNAYAHAYGAFSDVTDQSVIANTATVINIGSTDFASGVSIVDGSKITVAGAGKYNLQFSAQLYNTDTQIHDVSIWFRVNGVDLANSTSEVSVPNSHGGKTGRLIAAWNIPFSLNAGDYIQLVWSSPSTSVTIETIAPQTTPTRPLTPGLIVTIDQWSE